VTKRQSLKLLGEILLDRANFNVMTKFVPFLSCGYLPYIVPQIYCERSKFEDDDEHAPR
jgi:hypothetical protein